MKRFLLSLIVIASLPCSLVAQGTLEVNGLCIAAPSHDKAEEFVSFVDDFIAPLGINTLILRVDFNYAYTSRPELRDDNPLTREQVKAIVAPVNDADTESGTRAERGFLRKLEGGCQVPIGAFGEVIDGEVHLKGYVGAIDGSKSVRGEISGSPDDAASLGIQLANQLLKDGAEEILLEVREALEPNE